MAILVHLEVDVDELPDDYLSVEIDLPVNLKVQVFDAEIDIYHITETRAHGDRWLTSAQAAVFDVPSVVVPREHNVYLNPGHPDFHAFDMVEVSPFRFDRRLFALG